MSKRLAIGLCVAGLVGGSAWALARLVESRTHHPLLEPPPDPHQRIAAALAQLQGQPGAVAPSEGSDVVEDESDPLEPPPELGTIALEVLDVHSGAPAPRVRLRLFSTTGDESAPSFLAQSDRTGLAATEVPAGRYGVEVLEEGLAAAHLFVDVGAHQTTTAQLFVGAGTPLSCQVVNLAGLPLAGVRVEASSLTSNPWPIYATTDRDGTATFARIFPGRWAIEATASGFERDFYIGDVGPSAGRIVLKLRLKEVPADAAETQSAPLEPCAVSGRVVDENGLPMKAEVTVACGSTKEYADSQADGTFGVEGLARGQCALTATGPGEFDPLKIKLVVDCPGEARVVMPAGELEIAVADLGAAGATGLRVWLYPASGPERLMVNEHPAVFKNVPEGRARFYLATSAGAAKGEASLRRGEALRVTIPLGQGGVRLSGRVVHARTRVPLAETHVQLPVPFEARAWPQALTETSAEGRFAFSGVARGKGSVCIHHEGFLARCLIRDNEADTDLGDVALEPGATAFPEPEKLGITWSASAGGARVTSLAPGSAAAGVLKPGDLVAAVDGTPLDGLADFELSTLLLGPVGTPIRLEIRRDGGAQRVSLPR